MFDDEFIELLLEYKSMYSGEIKEYSGNYQFIITNDPLKLVFQWDGCYGITVIIPDSIDIDLAVKALKSLCNRLKYNESN